MCECEYVCMGVGVCVSVGVCDKRDESYDSNDDDSNDDLRAKIVSIVMGTRR